MTEYIYDTADPAEGALLNRTKVLHVKRDRPGVVTGSQWSRGRLIYNVAWGDKRALPIFVEGAKLRVAQQAVVPQRRLRWLVNTPLPWVAEPIDAEEIQESLKEERVEWVAIIGNVQLKAGRVEDEIWHGRSFLNVALCRRENAALLLTAPKLLTACKLLLSIRHDASRADADVQAAYATAEEAIAEAQGGPIAAPALLRAAGYSVRPDPNVPEKWIWRSHFHDPSCNQSFVSEDDAWRSAGEDYVKGIQMDYLCECADCTIERRVRTRSACAKIARTN